jgi:heme A synthase
MEKNDEEKQYLSEDKDLLNEIQAMGPSTSGVAETEKIHRLTIIQIKASLRQRKTARDLDESTRQYSLVLVAFALAQLALGVFEFLFNAEFSGHVAVGIIYVLLVTALIAYIITTPIKNISQ